MYSFFPKIINILVKTLSKYIENISIIDKTYLIPTTKIKKVKR